MNFNLDDNFEDIIKRTLNKKKLTIQKISTGWTNYVYKATVRKSKAYIFRFPRNNFFAQTLIKEEWFNKFISKKISFRVPNIKLYYDNNRPYTVHNYMPGQTLTERYDTLTEKQKVRLGKDIAKFIFQLQNINATALELPLLSEFLQGLSKVGDEEYDLGKHNVLLELEKQNITLAHADFNPGNILLTRRGKMFAVFDFAFVSFSSNIIDISRMLGRLPQSFEAPFLSEYEKQFNITIDKQKISDLVEMWRYVEEKYISYMRKNHTDVKLPNIKN